MKLALQYSQFLAAAKHPRPSATMAVEGMQARRLPGPWVDEPDTTLELKVKGALSRLVGQANAKGQEEEASAYTNPGQLSNSMLLSDRGTFCWLQCG